MHSVQTQNTSKEELRRFGIVVGSLLALLFGLALNNIVGPIVLGALFFLVFLPYGLVMRLMAVTHCT